MTCEHPSLLVKVIELTNMKGGDQMNDPKQSIKAGKRAILTLEMIGIWSSQKRDGAQA